jgi:hypothetical protein
MHHSEIKADIRKLIADAQYSRHIRSRSTPTASSMYGISAR